MLIEFLRSAWETTEQLAPWLLVGMALSGLAHVVLPSGWIRRRFQGFRGVAAAVALGVPMPLCSCGVIPAGIGLKNDGASNGSSLGFLISTPQTGVDSILVSAAFFGWPFAVFKMVGAMVLGLVGGWLAESIEDPEATDSASPTGDDLGQIDSEQRLASDHRAPTIETSASNRMAGTARRTWRDGFGFALEILRSIWLWLAIGIAVSALIDVVIPEQWIQSIGSWGLAPSMLAVLLVSVPLYVCATASVPIAASLVHSGFPPAAALVFLMAGPATNATTIGAVYGRFGPRVLAIYLATIVGGSLILAWAFASLVANVDPAAVSGGHDHSAWWEQISAAIVLGLVAFFAIERVKRIWTKRRARVDDGKRLVADVSGMNCRGCADRLTRSLENVDGVRWVQVQLDPPEATIVGNVTFEAVREAADRCGLRLQQRHSDHGSRIDGSPSDEIDASGKRE